MNNVLSTVYGVKIYPIDYLLNEEYSESDLDALLGQNSKSLKYSIIIGMLREIGIKKRNCDIIKQITTDSKWMYKYQWTADECRDFENKLQKIIKRLYSYQDTQALEVAQWYISIYGLQVKGNTIDL